MRHLPFRIFSGALWVFLFVLICPQGAILAATDSYYTKESFSITPGGSVVVEAAFHDVEVKITSGPSIEVEVKMEFTAASRRNVQRLIDEYNPVFTVDHGLLHIRSATDKSLNFLGSYHCAGSIKLTVPSATNLEIKTASGTCSFHDVDTETVVATTASGDISFRGTVQNLNTHTASGDISLRGTVENFTAHTASGEIRAEFARPAVSVEAHSNSGGIRMNGPVKKGNFNCIAGDIKLLGLRGGTINASTVSGDFSASWESIFEPTFLSAKSVSGSLRLYFPKDARIAGEINTSAGRIRTNFPGSFGNKGNSFFLQESEANVEVFASTVSGSVALLAQGDLAFAPYETMEEVETLVDEFKLHPHDPAPVAILNLYSYEKMLTPGLKFRLGDGLYATGNIEYSYRERDLNLQLGAVYSFPYDFCLLSFYGGGGVQFSTKKGIQYPYILIGANYFSFLFSELVYPWAIDTPPRSRFGLKINF